MVGRKAKTPPQGIGTGFQMEKSRRFRTVTPTLVEWAYIKLTPGICHSQKSSVRHLSA